VVEEAKEETPKAEKANENKKPEEGEKE